MVQAAEKKVAKIRMTPRLFEAMGFLFVKQGWDEAKAWHSAYDYWKHSTYRVSYSADQEVTVADVTLALTHAAHDRGEQHAQHRIKVALGLERE